MKMSKKKLILIIIGSYIVINWTVCGVMYLVKDKDIKQSDILGETYTISKQYLNLRYRTDRVLVDAEYFKDHNTWNNEMTSIIQGWEKLEKDAADLEKLADKYSKQTVFLDSLKIKSAYAYDEQEIYDIIDIAGPGKEIELLANYLGTDVATAHEILKQTVEQTNLDAEGRDSIL